MARTPKEEEEARRREYEGSVERLFADFAKRVRGPVSSGFKEAFRNEWNLYYPDEDVLEEARAELLGKTGLATQMERLGVTGRAAPRVAGPKKPRGRPQKSIDRRYRILAFVAERLRKGGSLRPEWKGLAEEWNSVHPFDPMTPDALKVEYNHVIRKEGALVFQYLKATRDDRPFLEHMRRAFQGRPLTRITTIEGLREHRDELEKRCGVKFTTERREGAK